MDDRSFALGNRILGNADGAPGLECTAIGPTLRFATDAVVCLTGADLGATLDGAPRRASRRGAGARRSAARARAVAPVPVCAPTCSCGAASTCARCSASASTFTLGGFGGHGGRELRTGDVLHLPTWLAAARGPGDRGDRPELTDRRGSWRWSTGPHAAPDFVTEAGIEAFYATDWQVHHHSSRTGVRLVGPGDRVGARRRRRGRAAPVEHPRHAVHRRRGRLHRRHADPPRSRRSEPRRLRVPGHGDHRPTGGSSASSRPATACAFVPVDRDEARDRVVDRGAPPRRAPTRRSTPAPTVLAARPAHDDTPQVTYRAQGDGAVLVEYGPMMLDLDLRLRAHALRRVARRREPSFTPLELTPGIRSLQVQFDPATTRRRRRRRCSRAPRTSCPRSTTSSSTAASSTCRCRGTTPRHARRSRATCASCATTRRGARGTSSSSGASTGSTTSTTCARSCSTPTTSCSVSATCTSARRSRCPSTRAIAW